MGAHFGVHFGVEGLGIRDYFFGIGVSVLGIWFQDSRASFLSPEPLNKGLGFRAPGFRIPLFWAGWGSTLASPITLFCLIPYTLHRDISI